MSATEVLYREQKNRVTIIFDKGRPKVALNRRRKLKGNRWAVPGHYLEGMLYSASQKYAAVITSFDTALRLADDPISRTSIDSCYVI